MSAMLTPYACASPVFRAGYASAYKILNERGHGAVEPLHFWIGGLDQVILVRRVRARAVTQAEVSRRQAQRRIGEHVSRPRAGRCAATAAGRGRAC